MVTANDVFSAAMSLMDELDGDGKATSSDTREYELRTPELLNALVSELFILSGEGQLIPVESMEDPLLGVPDPYGRGVLHYGLASHLLVDENPTAADFFEQRYEELRDRYIARIPASMAQITDLYGGIEHGRFGRW